MVFLIFGPKIRPESWHRWQAVLALMNSEGWSELEAEMIGWSIMENPHGSQVVPHATIRNRWRHEIHSW